MKNASDKARSGMQFPAYVGSRCPCWGCLCVTHVPAAVCTAHGQCLDQGPKQNKAEHAGMSKRLWLRRAPRTRPLARGSTPQGGSASPQPGPSIQANRGRTLGPLYFLLVSLGKQIEMKNRTPSFGRGLEKIFLDT